MGKNQSPRESKRNFKLSAQDQKSGKGPELLPDNSYRTAATPAPANLGQLQQQFVLFTC